MTQVRAMNAWVWPSSSWRVPPVETQVWSIVPLGHPCIFPFFYFPSLFLALLPFPVFPFLFFLSFRFAVLRLFLVSPSIFFSLPCSLWWRTLFICLGDTPPLRCLRACKPAYSPRVLSSFVSCVLDFCWFDFSSLLCLVLLFWFGRRLFHLVLVLWVSLCCLLCFGFCCVWSSH